MLEITEKKRLQVLELITGYSKGLITDRECNDLSDIILGEITKYKFDRINEFDDNTDYDKLAEEQAQQDAYESGRVFF